jgi:hypothetical protein
MDLAMPAMERRCRMRIWGSLELHEDLVGEQGHGGTAEQVGAVRKEIGNRTQPFTAAELLTVQ